MQNLSIQKPFISLKETLILFSGFIGLLLSLKLDKYINPSVVLPIVITAMILVEFLLVRIVYKSIYNSYISKINPIKSWSSRMKLVFLSFTLISLIWTVMLGYVFIGVL